MALFGGGEKDLQENETEEEEFFVELEKVAEKFKDILSEINKKFRQEMREVGVRKNVVPTKYILPKEYITRLLEYTQFRRVWLRKPFWVYLKEDDETEGRWTRVQTFPNIGGVPVEEGPELKVLVERMPRRKRQRKKDAK